MFCSNMCDLNKIYYYKTIRYYQDQLMFWIIYGFMFLSIFTVPSFGVYDRSDRRVLRVSTIVASPYVIATPISSSGRTDGFPRTNVIYSGYIVDLLERLSEILNFDFELNEVKDGLYGHYSRKTANWTGLVGELLREETDLSAAPLFITPSRRKVVAFTRPFLEVYATMLLRKMPEINPSSSVQSSRTISSRRSSAQPVQPSRPVSSLEDLVSQTEIKYGTLDTGIFVRLFEMSNQTLLSRIWRNMGQFNQQGYDVLMPTNEQGIARTRQDRYAYILPNTIADYVVNRAPCDLTTVDRFLRTRGYGFAVKSRQDPLLAELNIALDRLDAEGYLERLYHKWWRLKGDCFNGAARKGGSAWIQENGSGSSKANINYLLPVLWVICVAAVKFINVLISV